MFRIMFGNGHYYRSLFGHMSVQWYVLDHHSQGDYQMRKIPDDINTIVDLCFKAGIDFDLTVTIDSVPYHIVSNTDNTATVINQNGCVIGFLTPD